MSIPEILSSFAKETWWLTAEMAPYLLLGFAIAGLLRTFFTEEWVRKHLGQKGLYQIFKAVVIGIPLPLCSCGVIPVAAGIRRQGGQRGAVAAFTAATPQTGVDAIAATVGMLGWLFAVIRILLAFVNGVVAGLVVEKWGDGPDKKAAIDAVDGDECGAESEKACCCSGTTVEVQEEEQSCCSTKTAPASADPHPTTGKFFSGLRFGLITLPRDLSGPLILGLVLAGLIATFAPADLFTDMPGGLFGVYLGMTLISLPLYVCSTGSIPMAFTFLGTGMSPGAVLIFLIAGPASNTATVTSLWKMIGARATIGYVLSIIATSWVAAALLDLSGLSLLVSEAVHDHDMGVNLFQQGSAVLLIAILLFSKFRRTA